MKRLYKSRKNKVIAGVCGGIAEYFGVDPVLIRLVAVLCIIMSGGAAFIAYIIGMIIMPTQVIEIPGEGSSDVQAQNAATVRETEGSGHAGSLIIGVILIVFGIHFLLRNIPFFHPYYWWFWGMGWRFLWPSILIAIGLLILFRGTRK
jgi:phage shock protein C